MRTKTLLITAAALAAGVISSQAQSSVYSQNIVGYYNYTIPGSKEDLVSIQLQDANNTTDVNSQLTNGVANGSYLYIWGGSSFNVLTYYSGYGWYDSGGNFATNQLSGGTSGYLLNGGSTPMTYTVVGTVPTNNAVAVPAGFGFYGTPAPVVTNISGATATLVNFPSQNGDSYYVWNVTNQNYGTVYTFYSGYGWYDSGGNSVYPSPNVGGGFLYFNNGTATNWSYNYNP